MKKLITISIILFSLANSTSAQWSAVGLGMDNYVWGSAVFNGQLYASGNFEHADGNPAYAIAKWDGSAWLAVGGGFQHNAFSNVVRGLIVFNNELIAGGYIDSAGGVAVHKVAKWNGTSWNPVGTDCPINTVNCFAIHNGELYAGGEGSGPVKVCVAKWNGSNWIGLDIENANRDVWSLVSYNGNLYAGGGFSSFNGIPIGGVAKWDGNTWSDIGTGFTSSNVIRALAVYQNKLIIGGSFNTAGAIAANNIVAWDGTSWTTLSGGVNAGVQSLLSYGNNLFVGGTFWEVNNVSANRAAFWDGTSWTILGTDLGSGARTISVYNNELYFGGDGAFNGQNFIAKWGAGIFTGIDEKNTSLAFPVYPNPASEKLVVHRKTETMDFIISDLMGKNMNARLSFSKVNQDTFEINISDLTPGIYFLTAKNNSAEVVKFIVR